MTLKEYCDKLVAKKKKSLREIAKEDVARISKTIQKDPSGREHFWNGDFFESKPENDKTWILGIDSEVPGFWDYCPTKTGVSTKGYDLVCQTPNFVFIFQDGEKLTCRKCKKEHTIKIVTGE